MSDYERELGWDDEIEKDGGDFEILPEGDYDFEVAGFERERHPGSNKLPACNKAVVNIIVKSDTAVGYIKHNLFLHTKTEGLLSDFFTGIGQKKKGEKLKMNWSAVVGSTGRCKVAIRKWTGNDGGERSSNEIKKFYRPAERAPSSSQAPQGFTPGKF